MSESGRYVLIAGNIASGKSSLALALAQRLGFTAYAEPFEGNPFLEGVYAEPNTYAFRSQLQFMIDHFRQHQEMKDAQEWSVKDGSIFDSAEIVTRFLHERGYLSSSEWSLYGQLYQALGGYCDPPALIVCLTAVPKDLIARIRMRGRSFESGIDMAFLEALNHKYDEWANSWQHSPVLHIDSSSLGQAEVVDVAAASIANVVRDMLPK